MKTYTYYKAISKPSDVTGESLFLHLPLELRYEIYKYSIVDSRSPHAVDIHENLLSTIWEDDSSPLLRLNKQIRAEVCEYLKRSKFTMRITWQDKNFDCLALSSFIAQQCRKSFDDIPHLVVEIWPPHPDRPGDLIHIYSHLRRLRDDIRDARLPKLDLIFLENSIATWSDCGKPSKWLEQEFPESWILLDNDINYIIDLFTRIRNVGTVHICLPDSLLQDIALQGLARKAEEMMMRACIVPLGIGKSEGYRTSWEEKVEEATFKFKPTAGKYAQARIDRITNNGSNKISEPEWYHFISVWPLMDMYNCSWKHPKRKEGICKYAERRKESKPWPSSQELEEVFPFGRCDEIETTTSARCMKVLDSPTAAVHTRTPYKKKRRRRYGRRWYSWSARSAVPHPAT